MPPKIKCPTCKRTKKHYAKGLCEKCWRRQHKRAYMRAYMKRYRRRLKALKAQEFQRTDTGKE